MKEILKIYTMHITNITKIAVHKLCIYDYNNTRGRESVLN